MPRRPVQRGGGVGALWLETAVSVFMPWEEEVGGEGAGEEGGGQEELRVGGVEE